MGTCCLRQSHTRKQDARHWEVNPFLSQPNSDCIFRLWQILEKKKLNLEASITVQIRTKPQSPEMVGMSCRTVWSWIPVKLSPCFLCFEGEPRRRGNFQTWRLDSQRCPACGSWGSAAGHAVWLRAGHSPSCAWVSSTGKIGQFSYLPHTLHTDNWYIHRS